MKRTEIFSMMQASVDGMHESGMIEEELALQEGSALIGPGAVLDSIAFVTLFTDLEEQLSEQTGKEIYLLIDDVHAFNPEDTFLTVGVLADYIEHLLETEA